MRRTIKPTQPVFDASINTTKSGFPALSVGAVSADQTRSGLDYVIDQLPHRGSAEEQNVACVRATVQEDGYNH